MTFKALAQTPRCAGVQLAAAKSQRRAASLAFGTGSRKSVRCMASSASDWLKEDERRMLHVVYRVGDMQASIDYYKKHLGMELLRYRDIPEGKYTNAFLGYGPETTHFAVELTYNYGVDSYDLGTGFGHFGVALPDVYGAVAKIKEDGGKFEVVKRTGAGLLPDSKNSMVVCESSTDKLCTSWVEVSRDAGPVKGGNTVIAFVDDPTGYKWELITRQEPIPEPFAQVMLRVGDLDKSIEWYEKVAGMKLLRKRENPDYKYTLAFMGYGPEESSTVLELTYNWGVTEYTKGTGYAQVAISTKDVYKTAEQIRAAGGTITREPGPVPGIGTKIVAATDPDGWKYVFVDNEDFLKELA